MSLIKIDKSKSKEIEIRARIAEIKQELQKTNHYELVGYAKRSGKSKEAIDNKIRERDNIYKEMQKLKSYLENGVQLSREEK